VQYQRLLNDRDFFFSIRRFIRYLVKATGVTAMVSVFIASSFIAYDFTRYRTAFPPQTFIGKVEVTNLDKSEAIAKLKSISLSQVFTSLITLESDNQKFSFPPESLGVYISYDETVNNAFKMTHKGNYFSELKNRVINGFYYAPLFVNVDEETLRGVLQELANEVGSTPKDASIILYEETGGFHIEAEDLGREVNINKSLDQFKTYLYRGQALIPLSIEYEYPLVTEKVLRAHPPAHRLAAYTTYYGKHDSPNRIHNIKLVASWVDGTLLMPGDVFSVAETLGDVTKERGFKEAYVILGGELIPLLGGGSCQIATTLYNAVVRADLKVLQRRNHSFYFNIYPLGMDAGVYPGQLDFKFQNNTPYPILIKAVATNLRLSFRIYGTPTDKKIEVSDAAVFVGGKPASLGYVIRHDVPFATAVQIKVTGKDGQLIKQETVNSAYKLYGEKTNVPIRRPEPR